MNQLASSQHPDGTSKYCVHVISHTCGITVVAEGVSKLLWLTIAGKLELHQCDSSQQLLALLDQPSLRERIENEWLPSTDTAHTFENIWTHIRSSVAALCLHFSEIAIEENSQVTQRLRNQLLWSFDEQGSLDPELFLTILIYENVWLTNSGLIQLVSEMAKAHDALAPPRP